MRKISLLFSGIVVSVVVAAQPVLNSSNGFQSNTTIQIFSEEDPTVNQGSSGSYQTWDFSSLVAVNGSVEFDGALASSTPYASDFPEAQLASVNYDYSGNLIYNYFTVDNSHYTTWGYESYQLKLVYTDPRDILHFPFHYSDSFSDSYYAPLSLGFNAGVVDVVADGFGDLILPTGTFYNCLRVREIRKDTLDGDLTIITSNDTSYKFYVVNYPEPLCQLSYHHSSTGDNLKEIYWQDVQPSNVQQISYESLPGIFPNPCFDLLTVPIPFQDEEVTVQVTDATGRMIEAETHFRNDVISLNTTSLAQGVYLLTMQTKRKMYAAKFVKSVE